MDDNVDSDLVVKEMHSWSWDVINIVVMIMKVKKYVMTLI